MSKWSLCFWVNKIQVRRARVSHEAWNEGGVWCSPPIRGCACGLLCREGWGVAGRNYFWLRDAKFGCECSGQPPDIEQSKQLRMSCSRYASPLCEISLCSSLVINERAVEKLVFPARGVKCARSLKGIFALKVNKEEIFVISCLTSSNLKDMDTITAIFYYRDMHTYKIN